MRGWKIMSERENKENGAINRRDFLKVIGVAGGTAVLAAGCSSSPVDTLIPYVVPPEDMIPGIPKWYASTCRACPAGCGILVKNREGRAIKVEGNPASPINKGALCTVGQAVPQELYNPDRLRGPAVKNASGDFEPISWKKAEELLAGKLNDFREKGSGGKVVFITENVTGTFKNLIDEWLQALGGGGEHLIYETFSYEPLVKANEITFGVSSIPAYHIDKSDYLLSFGADYLETWLSPTAYQRGYSEVHSFNDHSKKRGKSVQIEPRMSLTGSNSDKWVPVKPGTEGFLALGIANVIVSRGLAKVRGGDLARIREITASYTPDKVASITEVPTETIEELARGFADARAALAIGGGKANSGTNSTETLAAINLLNFVAGSVGKTVDFSEPQTISQAASYEELSSLVESMTKGEVGLLLIHDTNPAFTLPPSLGFREAMSKVPVIVSFSSFRDETSDAADFLLPDHTNLEKWDDYSPRKGVLGLVQPAMVPVFNTKATGDVILSVSKNVNGIKSSFTANSYYDYLRDSWRKVHSDVAPHETFERFWVKAVRNGGVDKGGSPTRGASFTLRSLNLKEPEFEGSGEMYFVAYPSYKLLDGRGANKPWLQELPDALTTSVWGSWVEINPETARKFGVVEGDFLSIESPQGTIEVQAFVYEGIRPDTVAVGIGQGHTSYGRYANGVGVNPLTLLSSKADRNSGALAWLSQKVKVAKTGRKTRLVKTQYSLTQADREVAVWTSMKEATGHHRKNGSHEGYNGEAGFYPKHKYLGHRWGMSIDLDKCTGCGACVVACNAENNIPIVMKPQISKRREMSWIRIDRFFEKDSKGNLEVRFIPMPCQQCENAPCEPVCPVYATYTNPEGINAMIYNRCVGTRYCSNNCTYKVRRFNWFEHKWPEPLNWQLNPDVTVRSVGVMEKCTFCIQRIQFKKGVAKDEGRTVHDGEIQTACQQTCPSRAIVFGDINDPDTRVSKTSQSERGYTVFPEINTQPAVTYLKRVKWDKV